MSRFTFKKIKINDNNHLSSLRAEHSGDYDVKVWIFDQDSAWTGELSSAEAKAFISHYKLTEEIYSDELQRALTLSDPEVSYSIDKKGSGEVFSWKKKLGTGISIINGEMTVEKVALKDACEEVMDRSSDHLLHLQVQNDELMKEREALRNERDDVLSLLEKTVQQKLNFEETIYSQFLAVLNAKKEKIVELQEELDELQKDQDEPKNLKGTKKPSVSVPKKAEVRKRRGNQKKVEPEIAPVSKPVTVGEVNPYDDDTDVDDNHSGDSRCDDSSGESQEAGTSRRSSKPPNLQFRSSSGEMFNSFEEVPSPVAILPKRSKFNPKEPIKRSLASDRKVLNKRDSSPENVDDLLNVL